MADQPRRSKLTKLAASVAAVTLAATGCSKGGSTANGVNLAHAGKLTTCTNLPYPPFQYKNGSGKVVGFDVDLVDLAAKKLGLKQDILQIDFDQIKSGTALAARKCDVAAAGMTITPDRKQHLDFSTPYFDETLALVVKKGQKGVKTLDDVKSKHLKLGVQADTTSLDMAKKKGLDPVQFEDSGKQLLGLQSGRVDAVLQDLPVATGVGGWSDKKSFTSKFTVAAKIVTGAKYGYAVAKGKNPKLLKTINDELAKAISDGTWKKTYKKWMRTEPKTIPTAK